jgi:hypothetical protein
MIRLVILRFLESYFRHRWLWLAPIVLLAIIATYQQWRINSDQQESATAQQFFDGLIQKYQDDLTTARNALKTYLDQHPDPARGDRPSIEKMDIERLQGAIDLSLKQLGSALDKDENARLNMSRAESDVKQKYYVIDAPNFPEEPENSKDVRHILNLPVLASIPEPTIERAKKKK